MAVTSAGSSDGNLATTYALIYSFLTARAHDKAAAAVKKAAKDIVVLKDSVVSEATQLDEIIQWWNSRKEANSESDSGSESSSDSSDSSDSSSEGSNSDSSTSDPSSADSDSSDSSSSSEPAATKPGLGAKTPATVLSEKRKGKDVVVSLTTESNDPRNHKKDTLKKTKGSKGIATNSRAIGSDGSPSNGSSASSDDSSNDSDTPAAVKSSKAVNTPKNEVTVSSTSVSSSLIIKTIKKRRISESGNAVVTATAMEAIESSPAPNTNATTNGKKARKTNVPFQRIKAETVEFHDERLKDNAFIAKGGTTNDYGARANQDLIVTRGDGFRKEKNKKKRGSYRGGEITMESHSIKFT